MRAVCIGPILETVFQETNSNSRVDNRYKLATRDRVKKYRVHFTLRPLFSPQALILSSTDWKDQMDQELASHLWFRVSNLASGQLLVASGEEVE